jgi:hypothetical protein
MPDRWVPIMEFWDFPVRADVIPSGNYTSLINLGTHNRHHVGAVRVIHGNRNNMDNGARGKFELLKATRATGFAGNARDALDAFIIAGRENRARQYKLPQHFDRAFIVKLREDEKMNPTDVSIKFETSGIDGAGNTEITVCIDLAPASQALMKFEYACEVVFYRDAQDVLLWRCSAETDQSSLIGWLERIYNSLRDTTEPLR